MAILEWDASLSVDNELLDQQHKRLIFLANEFHDALEQGNAAESLNKLFNDLLNYAATHFSTEERLFEEYEYPETTLHKKAHDDLFQQVSDLKRKVASGEKVQALEVLDFLKDWIGTHIQGEDQKYSPFFTSMGLK